MKSTIQLVAVLTIVAVAILLIGGLQTADASYGCGYGYGFGYSSYCAPVYNYAPIYPVYNYYTPCFPSYYVPRCW